MPNANGIVKKPFQLTTPFSDPVTMTLDSAGTADVPLPDVVIPAGFFPIGAILKRVEVVFMWRQTENTNAALNSLSNPAQYVQIQKGAGALANAILFIPGELKTPALSYGSGDCVVGGIDVKATVDADDATYHMQWTDAKTNLDDIVLHDVRSALKFYFW
jgi:hypothetical protein